MFCKYCGNEINDDAGFCTQCGKAVAENPAQQQAVNPAQQQAVNPAQQQVVNGQNGVSSEKQGMAIASLVLGIVGLIAWFIPLFGYPVAITGIVLGIVAIKRGGKGMAIAGVVLATICLIASTANSAIGCYMALTGELWGQLL